MKNVLNNTLGQAILCFAVTVKMPLKRHYLNNHTANDIIKTDIVIKSIQSLSMLNFLLLAYGRVAERSQALVMYVIIVLHVMY